MPSALCLPRLALVPGDFGRDLAAQVAGAPLPVLAALVDKSLLLRADGSGRFSMHPLLRKLRRRSGRGPPTTRRRSSQASSRAGWASGTYGGDDAAPCSSGSPRSSRRCGRRGRGRSIVATRR
jgi:hypothetical protein